MKGFIAEFKEFALKGNMLDLAVGVIIGTAFGKVINSLVEDMLMSAIGGLFKLDFRGFVLPLSSEAQGLNYLEMKEQGLPYIAYGAFLTTLINFLLLAAAIFMVVKVFNTARKKFEAEKAAEPAAPPADVALLTEIRDLLKEK